MPEDQNRDYDDVYPTCAKTYSTLRIFSDDLAPDEITTTLIIQPTDTFRKGDLHTFGRRHRKANGWFYSTEQLTDSRDFRRHLDLILGQLQGKTNEVKSLRTRACKIDITTYWVSKSGHGGPWLMPYQMLALGSFGIPIWWDVYFPEANNDQGEDQSPEPKENL